MQNGKNHSAVIDGSTIVDLLTRGMQDFLLYEPSYYGNNFGLKGITQQLEAAYSDTNPIDKNVRYLRSALNLYISVLEPYLLYDNLIAKVSEFILPSKKVVRH